jgi:hypothetical protein
VATEAGGCVSWYDRVVLPAANEEIDRRADTQWHLARDFEEQRCTMIHFSCPSVYSCTRLEARLATAGDILSANGTPVFWPSKPWHTWQ